MKPITVELAQPADMDEVFRLNHQVYAEELGQDAVDLERHRLVDPRANESVYIVAKERGRVIGMVALTLPHHRFSIEDAMPESPTIARLRARSVELRRLALHPDHRRTMVFARLLRFLIRTCLELGFERAFISAIDTRLPMYEKMGFVPFEAPFTKGKCTYQPMMLVASNLPATLRPAPQVSRMAG